ncbi:hypothetical protein BGX27_010000 [Mortierella sp. AM989]|nr:hypothetical protein BGX27_010000 [Mortierella sp. AM989]
MVKFTVASLLVVAVAAISSTSMAAPIKPVDKASSDVFSSSVKYSGRATWFTGGYGACNMSWDADSEAIVALNAHQMGAASWGNPVCNKRVTITNKENGKTINARIVDKCPGDECAWGSLDLSPAAFKQLGHLDKGVLSIEWHYV